MNAIAKIEPKQPRSVIVAMADRYEMDPAAFEATIRATVCKGNVSREEFAAFLLVAKEYSLNPLTRELYAFPAKGGGIQPIVSIDGWARIINEHPAFDGMTFHDELVDGKVVAITCEMFRKDRSHAISATEYMEECRRQTDVWKTWPRRMLRHKAMIQAARYAFGFSGIVDPDEYERIVTIHTPERSNVRERLTAPGGEGFSTAFDPETGEITDGEVRFTDNADAVDAIVEEIEAEPSPGLDETHPPVAENPPQGQPGPTLTDRADAYEARLKSAPSVTKLKSLHAAAEKLRGDLDRADPERLAELDGLFNARFAELEDAEAVQ